MGALCSRIILRFVLIIITSPLIEYPRFNLVFAQRLAPFCSWVEAVTAEEVKCVC